jgi:phosphatidylethanolamine-binding protein (PEBP) family uncharacterized protein
VRRTLVAILATVFTIGVLTAPNTLAAAKVYSFTAEIWADNWFALYVNGKKVGEDSTPFATERSFNADAITFKASYPITIGIMARDYVENASGLEYIGKANQQIGDGGVIAQIRDVASGQVVTATNKSWKVFVTNTAPLNVDCVKSSNPLSDCKSTVTKAPSSWFSATYKDSTWKNATEFTAAAVGVKDGYSKFSWAPSSALVWSSDLKLDNTILLRTKILAAPKFTMQQAVPFTVGSPDFINGGSLPKDYTCDGIGISPALTFTGIPSNAQSIAVLMDTIPGPLRPGEIDIGNHFYLILYDIPTSTTSIAAGATNIGKLGQNFQGKKLGYTPPCSQGSGMKEYTISAFALSEKLNLEPTSVTEAILLKAIEGKIVAKSTLITRYQRP